MLLEVKDLTTYFFIGAGVVRAVDGVSYDVREGETVALVGESGCGKTVSALSVMRLVAAPAGRIVAGPLLFKGRALLGLAGVERGPGGGGRGDGAANGRPAPPPPRAAPAPPPHPHPGPPRQGCPDEPEQ